MYALCTSNVLAMSCAFRFIWIIILAHFSTGDDCRNIEFADRLENKALINHVIISFREIGEEICEIKCYLEPNCRSYNYGLLTNGTFLCELSDTQHMQALPDELEARNGFNYRSIEQDSCLSSSCSRNATCRAGFGDHGYLCVCPSSYYGDRCQLEAATTSAVSSTALTTESFHQTSPIVPLPTVTTVLNPSAASLTSSTIVSIQSSASVVSASCEAQWTGFGSSCYKIHSSQDWSNAKLNCQNFGGKLVKIESEDENHFIKTKFLSGGGGRYWIGLSDHGNEGDWRWTDGTGITGYEKWRSGQPNNHKGNQHCGAILKGNYYSANYNAEWNDERCSRTLDYICEK